MNQIDVNQMNPLILRGTDPTVNAADLARGAFSSGPRGNVNNNKLAQILYT